MSECNFCGCTLEKGTGKMYVLKSGKVFWFCSSKCEKNLLKLKRTPRLVKWTKYFVKGVVSVKTKKAKAEKVKEE